MFPIFATPGRLSYRSFTSSVASGVRVHERDGGASVNDLMVVNPTPVPVLLYEGEEVLGAQQNRRFDLSVLVAANSEVMVPVSCVEAGRWDGRTPRRGFRAVGADGVSAPSAREARADHP